ncbi:MAG: flagellar hook-basal body complex protein [candidate division KSB1 bacterium]|nr:flagellar hook-basal body complex protein [candidate division KSB1 bacterium]
MMRSLFAGVSGLRNHQVRMDVIGNNIANVNTIGYKASRVTFEESLAMTLRGATMPSGRVGGTNPVQVGLGMSVGTIDTILNQGSLQATGQQTDLAISGNGYFVLSDGQRYFFTRAGAFQFDANGRLVNPSNGLVVQGRMADARGRISSTSAIQDIVLPFGQKVPARATRSITFTGNLNAGEKPLGTITKTAPFLAVEEVGDNTDMAALYARGDTNSFITGMVSGVTVVTVNDGSSTRTYTYVSGDAAVGNGEFTCLQDLIDEINQDFAGSLRLSLTATGAIRVEDASGSSHTVTFTSNSAALQSALGAANGTVDSSTGKFTLTDEFSHRATKDEELSKLRNSVGEPLGIAAGDVISISAIVGGVDRSSTLTVTNNTTLGDLVDLIQSTFGITNSRGVQIDDRGCLVIHGDPGESSAIEAVSIRISGNPKFNTACVMNELQKAQDVTHSASITIYDELGMEHIVTLTFTKTDVENQWRWEAKLAGDEIISSGSTGTINFNSDGSLNSFLYDNGMTSFKFDPNNGASFMEIVFDAGDIGGFNGITQFASPSTAVASSQDGYPNGDLMTINIDETGKITGIFSNGVTQTLAQIALAVFNNPAGLLRSGENMYQISANSGTAVLGLAGESIQAKIVPGHLEMSNVDLAEEFTNMIVAQRGFQANARVITTTDDLLNELVNLKR